MISAILAALHLFALVAGLSAIVQRAYLLKSGSDSALRRVFRADLIWGAAAGLWIGTGLIRLLSGTDKGMAYYFQSSTFAVKMALFCYSNRVGDLADDDTHQVPQAGRAR